MAVMRLCVVSIVAADGLVSFGLWSSHPVLIESQDLTHLPLDKMATILADNYFKFIYFEWKW